MDVVKTNISKLGGIIDLQSEQGIGTKVTITLPITLAIISALVVRIGDRLFAIPLATSRKGGARPVERACHRRPRGGDPPRQFASDCRLAKLFGLGGSADGPSGWGDGGGAPDARPTTGTSSRPREREYVVVTAVGARRLGLVVSTLVGEQDVVIKALGPSLKGVRGFAGASELGDQRIAL